MELYPGWSARDNYGYGAKKKKRKKERVTITDSGGTARPPKNPFDHYLTCIPSILVLILAVGNLNVFKLLVFIVMTILFGI